MKLGDYKHTATSDLFEEGMDKTKTDTDPKKKKNSASPK